MKISNLVYLNSIPFRQLRSAQDVQYSENVGAECARLIERSETDFALVPVATLPRLIGCEVLPFGICADGAVTSVCVFSERPLSELEEILLDSDSRTSTILLTALLRELNLSRIRTRVASPVLIPSQITGATGGLLIGDNALRHLGRFSHVADLAELWKDLTGLPLAFAVWVTTSTDDRLISRFRMLVENALMEPLPDLSHAANEVGLSAEQLKAYLTKKIHYSVTPEIWSGTMKLLTGAEGSEAYTF